MKIKNSVAFVTGANRGLGLAYAKALLAAGASKVYAGARDPATVPVLEGLVPVRLDVNKAEDLEAAAQQCGDVDLLINNAGVIAGESLLAEAGAQALRVAMETNLYGMLATSQAFAPVLKRNGGGVMVNMLSALSWVSLPGSGPYSVTKAAAWALSNGLRNELRGQGTQVVSVHAGYIDTDMVASVTAPKSRPADIAAAVMAGIEAGDEEVLSDETSRQVKQGFAGSMYLNTQRN